MRSSRSRCSIDGTGLRPDNVAVAPETTFRLSEDTYLEPDIVICPRDSWPAGLSGGNVLLVVEIADSSLSYDMGRKAALYASFGVRELWVMDAVKLSTRMFHDPARTATARPATSTRQIGSRRSLRRMSSR